MITLTIPNDDHIALRAFGKALEEMALAHGAEPVGELSYKVSIDTTEATAAFERFSASAGELIRVAPEMVQAVRDLPEIDTTAQQVESLAQSEIKVTEQMVKFPVMNHPMDTPHVDSTGTPWDERIHSASKALNADGTWRLRRKPKGMGEAEWFELVQGVENELQYQTEQQPMNLDHASIDPAHETAEPPVTPPGDDFHTDAGVVTEHTVAGIPPLPVPPPVVVAPPVPEVTAWDFPRLMTFLTERQGKIDVATVNMLLAQDGIASLPELNAHPDKIGPFVARVKAHLGE